MGGDGKRKIGAPEEEVEQNHSSGDEEEKIEEFFAIIKRLRHCSRQLEASNKDAKKVKVHGPAWIPVFKLEDFAGQEKEGNPNVSIRCCIEEEISNGKEKGREEKGLDLDLTL
ncbi:hypothetical protein L484_018872 [Morus notabilis]|uniref:Uncharacterized protein n=1 Tax=Morus notabilis TaxID=981085 RepID=W9QSK5_9ROSA|nr:protein NEGATIVE REGULATOR OF RESISTANCE [Morus notabilis]EXB52988.1 hypothetical protein L484_018872 [Morus notabilis]